MVPGQIGDGPGWLRGVYGEGIELGGGEYYALLWVAFLAYLGVLTTSRALAPRWIWIAIGVLVTAFALAPPLLSADVFSYISYSRLGAAHGLNPYVDVPASVPADPAFAHVGWRDSVSAYGPLFTLGTYPLGLLSLPLAFWALKGIAAASVLAIAVLVARIAALRGLDPAKAAAFVALNPLVLVHVVGGAHNDAVMMALVLAGAAALAAQRQLAGGAALLAGAAVKVSAAFAAPFALLATPRRGRFVLGAAIAAALLAAASLAVFGAHALDSLVLVGENQAHTSRYSVPATLSRLAGVDVDTLRAGLLVGYAALLAWLALWTAPVAAPRLRRLARCQQEGDWVRAAGWAAFGLLLATGWLLPWYLLWAIPFAAVSGDRALAGSVLALTAFQLINRLPM
ncbi:MAG: alpha,6-mannosyltransferase [Solirubrobacterales bacterium]|jgi:hypothetical protein|nr:alpha,6-mannosyltransferase [Solirubrobacterales bacterium]MDX6652219.1 alpha,6-mannosyltransferase [Solirubrobacterales bacterium]MDX6662126.1 alpha,6-mannosyltransferase [Solirubrobacterales bacterium]